MGHTDHPYKPCPFVGCDGRMQSFARRDQTGSAAVTFAIGVYFAIATLSSGGSVQVSAGFAAAGLGILSLFLVAQKTRRSVCLTCRGSIPE